MHQVSSVNEYHTNCRRICRKKKGLADIRLCSSESSTVRNQLFTCLQYCKRLTLIEPEDEIVIESPIVMLVKDGNNYYSLKKLWEHGAMIYRYNFRA